MRMRWTVAGMLAGAMAATGQTALVTKAPAPVTRVRGVHFNDQKPVLGLPPGKTATHACTPGGTAFVGFYDQGEGLIQTGTYRVSPDGTALAFQVPQPPIEYTNPTIDSDFVNDRAYVTLFRAEKRDPDSGRVLDRKFFISKQPLDGSDGEVVALDVKFRPLSIALLESGDYLVIGWDEANLIPELAMIKPNGTVRRFVDLDNRASSGGTIDPFSQRGAAARPSAETLKMLQNARFTPFGTQVVMAAVRGTEPLHIFSSNGDGRLLPLVYPSGMVLHDVLPSGWGPTLMVRFEAKPGEKDKPEPGTRPYQRLFDVDALHGSLVTEFTSDTPAINDVSCAPPRRIAAIYMAPDPDASKPAPNPDGTPARLPTRLVVATTPR